MRWDAPGRGAFTPLMVAILCLLLAFGFLGSRGIWEPDEGRYTNVALTMLSSGDWLNPMRNGDTGHWTKPPVTYWLIAASVSAFGRNPSAEALGTPYRGRIIFSVLAHEVARPGDVGSALSNP